MLNRDTAKKRIDIDDCYNRYGPMVLRRCRSLLKDEEVAYDAMQEVFEKVLKNIFRLDGTALSSLLYRMATNLCLNKIRDERKHRSLECEYLLNHVPAIDGQAYGVVAGNLLEYILKDEKKHTVPPPNKKSTHRIAVMYFVNSMTLKEIADVEKMSVSGVHKRLDKVIQFLKKKGGQQ